MGSSIIQRNAHELGTFNSRGGRNFLNLHDSEDEGMSKREYQDREQLARLGKKSVLKVLPNTAPACNLRPNIAHCS
jgi:hypothetical protein